MVGVEHPWFITTPAPQPNLLSKPRRSGCPQGLRKLLSVEPLVNRAVARQDFDIVARLSEGDSLGEELIIAVLGIMLPASDAVASCIIGREYRRQRAVVILPVLRHIARSEVHVDLWMIQKLGIPSIDLRRFGEPAPGSGHDLHESPRAAVCRDARFEHGFLPYERGRAARIDAAILSFFPNQCARWKGIHDAHEAEIGWGCSAQP